MEDTIGDLLEAGLFGVTVLQPNILLAMFFIKATVISSVVALVDRGILEEDEAITRARNICAKMWRLYGQVQTNLINTLILELMESGLSWPRVDWSR